MLNLPCPGMHCTPARECAPDEGETDDRRGTAHRAGPEKVRKACIAKPNYHRFKSVPSHTEQATASDEGQGPGDTVRALRFEGIKFPI